ncbi:ATP-binding protein [Agathobaculum desmolans]|uniref:ATP-binding protein n=1 Tax=Agathobaculum desmolans TaxID=39484 RepID=UPI002ED61311
MVTLPLRFTSSMSHDIRTPMNAIVGMTTLALANLDNTDKLEDYLYKISVSSQHLLSLINDILDMSQIEQSKIHLNLQAIRIEELLGNISSIMTTQAESMGLCFNIETGVFRHSRFTGDALRIKQILINLLSNAFKFTLEGGTVTFRIEELGAENGERVRYRFTVQDTGIGISDKLLSRLFEPFNRSEKVSKVEGTGLGLSITKGLVDLMGGTIQVESKQEQGTKFEVELEFDALLEQEQQPRNVHVEVESGDLSGYHFLLVEDNEINSEILGELLQMWGATFTLVCNGLQAVNEFNQSEPETYDAIFMDIQMPVMNGYEATREIRKLAHPDAASIPIFAMTANAFAQDVRNALEAGMNAHISKPVEMDLLYSTVSKYLKKKTDPPQD